MRSRFYVSAMIGIVALLQAIVVPLDAQQVAPTAARAPVRQVLLQTHANREQAGGSRSRWPFVIIGAVGGGVVGGMLAWDDVRRTDAILGEVGIAIAAVGGALVGAGLGLVVHWVSTS